MSRIGRGIGILYRTAIRLDQREVLAITIQAEIRVKPLVDVGGKLVRCKNNEITVRRYGHGREGPFNGICCIVCQVPAHEVHRV